MKQWRKIASIFLLLAYIFVLATSLVSHHHHIFHSNCVGNSQHHDNNNDLIIVDCFEKHDHNRGCPQKSNKCDDIQCISRVVYLSNGILKQANGGDDLQQLPTLMPYLAVNIADVSPVSTICQQPNRLKYYNPGERIVKLLLSSSVGLRAPPVQSFRG
jgi:hypothetical protein